MYKTIRKIVETKGNDIVLSPNFVNILDDYGVFNDLNTNPYKYVFKSMENGRVYSKLCDIGTWNDEAKFVCQEHAKKHALNVSMVIYAVHCLAYGLKFTDIEPVFNNEFVNIQTPDSNDDNCQYVDLGLPSGTLWSNINIGAKSVSDKNPSLFAWGETSPKGMFRESNYSPSNVINGDVISGTINDAATILLGNGWRIPTVDQCQELLDNTTQTKQNISGNTCLVVKSKINQAEIIIPEVTVDRNDSDPNGYDGFGFWTGTRCSPKTAYRMWEWNLIYNSHIHQGFPIRPVKNKLEEPQYVDLGLPSGTLWSDKNIGAQSVSDKNPFLFAWGEAFPKNRFLESNYSPSKAINRDVISGTINDAATILLGNGWQIPTVDQCQELLDNTTQTKQNISGNTCLVIKSKINQAEIIIPEVTVDRNDSDPNGYDGFGFWTGTRCSPRTAYRMWEWNLIYNSHIHQGFPIRPVINKRSLK